MITLKNSLAIVITIVLAIVAYIASAAELLPSLQHILPSIFVVLTGCSFMLTSFLTGNSTSSPSVSVDNIDTADIATLYIGNLAYKANEKTVQDHFAGIGHVHSVRLVKDKRTGRRKGFGFVEVNKSDEDKFIDKMNESLFMERNIIVRPANDKQH